MTQDFRWSTRAERAAMLAADDTLSDEEIARRCRVSRSTITRYRRHPAFAARVAEHLSAQRAAIEAEGIADKRNRVAAYDDRWRTLRALIEARGRAMAGEVAGGETGLLVREVKIVKVYEVAGADDGDAGVPVKRAVFVPEYKVDAALLAELRQLEKQAAQDLGQWTQVIDDRRGLDEAVERLARDRGLDPDNAARLKDFAAERARRRA